MYVLDCLVPLMKAYDWERYAQRQAVRKVIPES